MASVPSCIILQRDGKTHRQGRHFFPSFRHLAIWESVFSINSFRRFLRYLIIVRTLLFIFCTARKYVHMMMIADVDIIVLAYKMMFTSYIIFVIFLTQAKFLENKIYTKKRVNYDKLHSKLPILRVNYDKLHSKLPIFRVKSVKIYTGQKKFTRAPPVAPVTNMRYGRSQEV